MRVLSLQCHSLGRVSSRRGLNGASGRYLLHVLLSECFGDKAPPVWDAKIGDAGGHVLSYSETPMAALQEYAQMKAPPSLYRCVDWGACADKPLPLFPSGMDLGYEVRCVPVVRKASSGSNSSGRTWHEGQELDAFLSEVWEIDDDSVEVDREDVYADWLDGYLERGGAEMHTCRLESFDVRDMTRRHHGQGLTTITRPDATLSGRLTVQGEGSFQECLLSGIGRHTTFGYGMLKIEP